MAEVKELPEELIALILSKLPVKSLLRFKCVRKPWYALIQSPHFIHLHLKSSSNNNYLIVRRCCYQQQQQQHQPPLIRHVLSFHSHETLAHLGTDEIITPFSKQTEVVSVSGPCNGLICIVNNNDQIVICNPSMREFRSLFVPPAFGHRSGYHYDTVAFGFDPNSCEYKVLMIGVFFDNSDNYNPEHEQYYERDPDYRGDREAKVYDFSTDSWRDTGLVVPDCFLYSPVAVSLNGAFHWIPFRFGGDAILSFLISDEVSKEIPLPEFYDWDNDGRERDLFVMNNSQLALIVYSNPCLEISVMTEYGVKESWTKLFLLGPFPDNYFRGPFVPLAFWNSNGGDDDQILLETSYLITDNYDLPLSTTRLVACDLQHQNITHFPIYGLHPLLAWDEYSADSPRGKASFDVLLYSESLVSVNGIGGGESA